MTNVEAFKKIRGFGMAVQLRDGEWCVNFQRNDARWTTASCYFTDDRDDAINTAAAMAQCGVSVAAPAYTGVPSSVFVVRYRWTDLGFAGWTVDGSYYTEEYATEAAEKLKADVGAADRQLLSVQVLTYNFADKLTEVL